MMQPVLRWSIPLVALLVLGPAAGWLTSSLHAVDGGHATSLLLNTSRSAGALAGLGVLALAAIVGLAAARLISPHYGLFSAGLVLAWGAWGTGTIDQISRATPSGSIFTWLAFEAALLLPPAVALAWAVIRFGRHPAGSPHQPEPKVIKDRTAGVGFLAAAAVGAIVAWLIALESLKGQAFGAAAIAGLLGAAAGRLVATRVSAAVFVAGLAVVAIASPVSALAIHGSGMKPVIAAQGGTLFNLARVLPLDWLAGAFVGVPLGLSWAGGMLEQHAAKS